MSWMERAFLKAKGGSMTSLPQDLLQHIANPKKVKISQIPGSPPTPKVKVLSLLIETVICMDSPSASLCLHTAWPETRC